MSSKLQWPKNGKEKKNCLKMRTGFLLKWLIYLLTILLRIELDVLEKENQNDCWNPPREWDVGIEV